MPPNDDTRTPSVLVIDDDELMLFQVELVLGQAGIEQIVTASGGKDALDEVSHAGSFDILILDMNMPDMSGYEVLEQLGKMQYGGAIALFSGEDPLKLKAAIDMGEANGLRIIGILPKPVTLDEASEMLNKQGFTNG